jgi:hypothetical protein
VKNLEDNIKKRSIYLNTLESTMNERQNQILEKEKNLGIIIAKFNLTKKRSNESFTHLQAEVFLLVCKLIIF